MDEDGTRVQAAKAAEEALRLWKGWKKDSSTSQALHNSAMFPYEHPLCSTSEGDVATVYLAGVPARSARERHQVKPGVVRLVNEGQTFSVTRGDSSRAYPKRVLLDTGAQPVMLGRRLANELGLVPHDLDPCPFTIATSLGGTKQPTGLTKEPLRLQFKVGADSYTYVAVRCVVTSATTYDILLGQQALYPIGFGHDSWTEEAWFRPGWSLGDGHKENLPVSFSNLAGLVDSEAAMYGCVGLADTLPTGNSLLEGNMSALDTAPPSELKVPGRMSLPGRRPKDPLTPWGSSKELTQRCRGLVEGVDRGFLEDSGGQPPLQQLVNLHHSPEGIVLVELFAGLSTGLAAVLEAGLFVSTYVYVDNNDMVSKAAKHHIKQLQARYPRQLPASAVQGCMSRLPGDISLIGEEDLQRLGRVDLVMAGWPCQGHSRAGLGKGLQDPRSGLFWELLRLLRWWQRMQATPVGYILENVPPLGIVDPQVQADAQLVCRYLGKPVAVDAAALGSYAHRLRWKWTNLASASGISAALHQLARPAGRHVDHILDRGRHAQVVVHADQPPLAVVNQVGMPRLALSTLVSYPGSHAFRDHGPGLVWDTTTRRLEEPRADERERAMGFLTGTTTAPELTESQRRQILGQAMDLTSMVWFVGVCLAVQQYNTSGLGEHLGANGPGQGAQEDAVLADMGRVAPEESSVWKDSQQAWDRVLGEIKNRDAIEWLV